jgi:hypothetical protein
MPLHEAADHVDILNVSLQVALRLPVLVKDRLVLGARVIGLGQFSLSALVDALVVSLVIGHLISPISATSAALPAL